MEDQNYEQKKKKLYESLREKYQLYTPEARQQAVEAADAANRSAGMVLGTALSGLGQSFQIKGGVRNNIDTSYFDDLKKQNVERTVGEFDKAREATLREYDVQEKFDQRDQQREMEDANSDLSNRTRQNYENTFPSMKGKLGGYSAAQMDKIMGPLLEQANEQTKRQFELNKQDRAFRHDRAMKQLEAAENSSGKELPPAMVKQINEGNAIPIMLQNTARIIDKNEHLMGPVVGRARGANPYDTDAQSFDAEMRATSQLFGRYMENGVLRKEDEEKYARMFPAASDKPAVARKKLQAVNRLLVTKQKSDIEAFRSQGYNMTGLEFNEKPLFPEKSKEDQAEEKRNEEYVTVTNGEETLRIPKDDLADAQKDGFRILDSKKDTGAERRGGRF